MTEEQLETIRREYELLDYYETSGWHDVAEHVPALLAEIDRLRKEVAYLEQQRDSDVLEPDEWYGVRD